MNDENKLLHKLDRVERLLVTQSNQGKCIMISSTLFESDVDLFEHLPKIDQAIQTWKSIHPLLRCKVVEIASENVDQEPDLFFAYADEDKINSLDNVTYLRLEANDENNDHWRLLLNREGNSGPINIHTGLLWRLTLVRLTPGRYSLMLTLSHGISDGLNSIAIIDQLVSIVDQLIDGSFDPSSISPFESIVDVEQTVVKLTSAQFDPSRTFTLETTSKIPKNLSTPKVKQTLIDNTGLISQDRLVNVKTNESIFIRDVVTADASSYESKIKTFSIDQHRLAKLLSGCREVNAKLTGCLLAIISLAVRDLYNHYDCSEYARSIVVNLLANYRPFVGLPNTEMSVWSLILKIIVDMDDSHDVNDRKLFWQMSKRESDRIHGYIQGDMLTNLILGRIVLSKNKRLNHTTGEHQETFTRGAGVHCSLSNKLTFKQTNMNHVRICECYSYVTCTEGYLIPAVSHGMYTINNRLCWSIGYNCGLVCDEAIDYLTNSLNTIINNAIAS